MAYPPTPAKVSARASALAERRTSLQRDLSGRFWLRVHASVIVAGTFGAGFLANRALLGLGLDGVVVRWLIAIAIGYAMFFLLVRVWLAYVGIRTLATVDVGDGGAIDWPAGQGGAVDVPLRGGGGQFGGGGASGNFGIARVEAVDSALPRVASAGGKAKGGFGFGVDLGDAGFLLIVLGIIVLAVVAALAGSAIHIIWIAPDLFADAAFGALLASGALPGLRRIDEPDWDGHVFRATWKPLLVVVVVAAAAAIALGHWFPEARTLGDAWRSVREALPD
jgi:hypothetical protein